MGRQHVGSGSEPLTSILKDAVAGDPEVASRLLPLVYEELHRLAEAKMVNEPADHTLQPTALVHEAYLRLLGDDDKSQKWDNRGHFFAAAAEAMRRILVERARKYRGRKHGGGRRKLTLAEIDPADAIEIDERIIDLDEALHRFEAADPNRAQVVKLRYFAGLTIDQTARTMGISPATANRYWEFARAWLCDEVSRAE